MRLSRKAIDELKRIYAEECGAELSDAGAQALGVEILDLFDLVTSIPPDESTPQSTG